MGEDAVETGPWNPGLTSSIPQTILPLSTMFRPVNVETDIQTVHELSDFCGLSPFDIVVFRCERLILHGLLIQVTITLSVPDGPGYEELGINLRGMVRRIYETHVEPELEGLKAIHEEVRREAKVCIGQLVDELRSPMVVSGQQSKGSPWQKIFDRFMGGREEKAVPFEHRLSSSELASKSIPNDFNNACQSALFTVVNSIIGHRGSLVGDDKTIIELATGLVLNDQSSLRLGAAVTPLFERGAKQEGYRFLPSQDNPFIMNVKGASAAGKSTIRPKQRALAEEMGIAWEDFALVSPDYWRKYLLDYDSLGEHKKYGAMLTGHELAIIDRKLDRQMARRAEEGKIPHLLIDRFRFDSFNVGEDQSSKLLTRFGHTVFMFYIITPPEETVERAYQRGLTTGRYKAVDDLLDHNIEAYTGMPELFFSWASTDKRVHHEFLDNGVPKGCSPKTVAFGWNGSLTILDISKLLDIERYKQIDVDANTPEKVYLPEASDAASALEFLQHCATSIAHIKFADQKTGRVFGEMIGGEWTMRDEDYVGGVVTDPNLLTGLEALGWTQSKAGPPEAGAIFLDPASDQYNTLGDWGGGEEGGEGSADGGDVKGKDGT